MRIIDRYYDELKECSELLIIANEKMLSSATKEMLLYLLTNVRFVISESRQAKTLMFYDLYLTMLQAQRY